ncbi:50S ribosomal protein L22 [Sphingobacteriales bacterium UPWRP_1]|nr:50S ribosomal protein L22 [Sphingobacteriales bacterium TSM_CSS]PSJ76842.1 50S ribosomal protein L22 [Sphingobacteriales bacterium UPWRP_1]
METIARLRNYPTSPRKMRLLADVIRGKRVEDALKVLKFSRQHASRPLEQLLLSAIANRQNSEIGFEEGTVFVKEIKVDSGRMLKRFRPAPHGRAHRIRKRSNHITIVLAKLENTATSE